MEAFEAFWSAYPRRIGKGEARRIWQRLRPDAALLARMLAALDWQRESEQWTRDGGQFIPHPATWLRQERWDDEPPAVKAPASIVARDDWFEECQRLHQGECGGWSKHRIAMARPSIKAVS